MQGAHTVTDNTLTDTTQKQEIPLPDSRHYYIFLVEYVKLKLQTMGIWDTLIPYSFGFVLDTRGTPQSQGREG